MRLEEHDNHDDKLDREIRSLYDAKDWGDLQRAVDLVFRRKANQIAWKIKTMVKKKK